jgi:hypothetical protein
MTIQLVTKLFEREIQVQGRFTKRLLLMYVFTAQPLTVSAQIVTTMHCTIHKALSSPPVTGYTDIAVQQWNATTMATALSYAHPMMYLCTGLGVPVTTSQL